ncbi:unnamed protein product [Paramecium pentaurelia]|uniref:VIT domain-containing protein n=1 Tax=Paramecium pentaurelia TaxID=43138 RepID=A0A8S1YI76_9CILI|nr:unnamed protein product [Paramecium pentaurelia]
MDYLAIDITKIILTLFFVKLCYSFLGFSQFDNLNSQIFIFCQFNDKILIKYIFIYFDSSAYQILQLLINNLTQRYNPKLDDLNKSSLRTKTKNQAQPIIVCYDSKTKLPIELKQVQYTVNIQPGLAVAHICQIYSTEENKDQCELEYLFTIDQNSAVTKMIVELGDQKVYGVIKELEEAKKEYEKGLQEGKTMVLSQEDSKISNIKKVKIGYLNPINHQKFNLNTPNNYKYF